LAQFSKQLNHVIIISIIRFDLNRFDLATKDSGQTESNERQASGRYRVWFLWISFRFRYLSQVLSMTV